MMSKKSNGLTIEKVADVNDYLCDQYDILKKIPNSVKKGVVESFTHNATNQSNLCFKGLTFDGSTHFIKKCSKSYVRRTAIDNPWNEINALQIISLIDSEYFPTFITAVEDHKYIVVISQMIDGADLFDKIKESRGGLPVDKAQRYLIQISEAVDQLHRHNVAHLDLSVENIIIDRSDNVKIIDFGVSSEILPDAEFKQHSPTSPTLTEQKTHGFEPLDPSENDPYIDPLPYSKHTRSRVLPGKNGYRAPEIERRQKCDPRKADAFSIGYIAWTMLCETMPFGSADLKDETFRNFMEHGAEEWMDIISRSMNYWNTNEEGTVSKGWYAKSKGIPLNAIKMMDELMENNPNKRKSIEELLKDRNSFLHFESEEKKCEEKEHDVVRENIDSLKRMDLLLPNPVHIN